MKYRQLLLGITAVMSFPLSIQAQTMDQMEPLERAKEEQIAREARLGEERIHVQEDANAYYSSIKYIIRWSYYTGRAASTGKTHFFCVSYSYCEGADT